MHPKSNFNSLLDNKLGAGSTLANSPADGYTRTLATGTFLGIDQYLYKFKYKATDFTPIVRYAVSPLVLAVNPKLPINSVTDVAAATTAHRRV